MEQIQANQPIKEVLAKRLSTEELSQFNAVVQQYQKASDNYADEILRMEQQFRKQTQHLTKQRGQVLKTIPGFWAQCFFNHRDTKPFVDDQKTKDFLTMYLVDIEVMFAFDDRFGQDNVKRYGKDGMVITAEF